LNDLKIDWCDHKAASYACINWHYSGVIPVGKLVKVGVWEGGKFIGCVLFGRGANKGLGSPFGLDQTEVCELVRIALTKHSAPVSRIMMLAIKFLKRSSKGIKLIVSFADTEQGHHGGIYQATNWIYNGQTKPADEYLYEGKKWHGRAFRKSKGSHLKYIDKGLEIIKGSSKHRYLMPLTAELKSKLDENKLKYPKRVTKAISGDQSESGGAIPTYTLHTSNDLSNG